MNKRNQPAAAPPAPPAPAPREPDPPKPTDPTAWENRMARDAGYNDSLAYLQKLRDRLNDTRQQLAIAIKKPKARQTPSAVRDLVSGLSDPSGPHYSNTEVSTLTKLQRDLEAAVTLQEQLTREAHTRASKQICHDAGEEYRKLLSNLASAVQAVCEASAAEVEFRLRLQRGNVTLCQPIEPGGLTLPLSMTNANGQGWADHYLSRAKAHGLLKP